MPSSLVVFTANVLQTSIPLFSLAAYVPQWVKLVRQRSSGNLSLLSWTSWTLTSSFALFYAVVRHAETGNAWALVFSAGSNLCFVLITIGLILRYRSGWNDFSQRLRGRRTLLAPKRIG
jgi:uncharacterized protein with PQ loop repeat